MRVAYSPSLVTLQPMSTLSVVATPIGNMEDITLRALRVLREADVILCEDTRVTKKLLDRYEIVGKRVLAYHSHSTLRDREKIFELLAERKKVALVSDAGTPAISDPGCLLVSQVREKFNEEVTIEAIPGASAVTTALSISGFPSSEFVFLGFLPHKKGRETLFREIADAKRVVVFYESPHRILKSLESLLKHCGEERRVAIGRELTKMHEELVVDLLPNVIAHFVTHPDRVRGEFVVMVSPLHQT